VEEAAAAAQSLEEQARTLAQAVAVFKVAQAARAAAPARPAPAKPAPKVTALPAGRGAARAVSAAAAPRQAPAEDKWQEF